MNKQIKKLPAGSVEFIEGYYITPAAEIYQKLKDGYRKSNGSLNPDGYLIVKIKNKNKYIHRIFAETYIPNPTDSKHVYFKSDNKKDISIENLSWDYMCPNASLLESIPADAKRYKEIYLVTKEVEIYKDCGEGKCYKLNQVKLGKGKYYTVLINNKREYVHKIYAEVYMNNYNPSKPVYFKDNNNENITLDNLTQNVKDKNTILFNYNHIICPICKKNKMQMNSDMCWECKGNKKQEDKRNKKRRNNKDLANKLLEISKYKTLTEKQKLVLSYLAEGFSQMEISRKLGVSRQDINSCINNMNIKLSKLKKG